MRGQSEPRHILSLSGGKDSTALAVYMKHKVPQMEYVFCDTGKELPETYEYLNFIEAYLGKPIMRLNSDHGFDHWLSLKSGLLPSPQMRWCTEKLKLKPFEKYVGGDLTYSYLGLRADEDRKGYLSQKPNIIPVYPFKEAGIIEADVYRILEEVGLGLPAYYEWRTRSGCYFCFFQRRAEWIGLKRRHPELFEVAKSYEKVNAATGERFTWIQGESLDELSARETEILNNYEQALRRQEMAAPNRPLIQLFEQALNQEHDGQGCLICQL